MIRPLDIPIDLRAEEAVGERVIGITRNPNCPAIPHRHQHGAGIRAVMRARTADDGLGHVLKVCARMNRAGGYSYSGRKNNRFPGGLQGPCARHLLENHDREPSFHAAQ